MERQLAVWHYFRLYKSQQEYAVDEALVLVIPAIGSAHSNHSNSTGCYQKSRALPCYLIAALPVAAVFHLPGRHGVQVLLLVLYCYILTYRSFDFLLPFKETGSRLTLIIVIQGAAAPVRSW